MMRYYITGTKDGAVTPFASSDGVTYEFDTMEAAIYWVETLSNIKVGTLFEIHDQTGEVVHGTFIASHAEVE